MIAIWITDKGAELPVGAMSTEHVRACIGAIERGIVDGRPFCNGFHNREWVKIFQTELVRRNRLGVTN